MERSISTRKLIASLYSVYSMLDDENTKSLDNLMDVIRNMELVELINNTDSICIAGMQGTGKTTLIKNLYGFPEDLLRISNDRGEKIPVFVKEDKNLSNGEYRAKRIYVDTYSGENRSEDIDVDDLANLSRKKDNTICLELITAQQYFPSGDGAFILLPGFEKKTNETFDDNYNAVINCCLHFSKAVLLVTDNQNIANSDIDYLVDSLLAHGFDGKNTVFAITKCDSNVDPNFANDVKESLKGVLTEHKFDTDDSRIINCDYRTESWKEKVTSALDGNVVMPFVEKKRTYLKPMIDQILQTVNAIEDDLKSTGLDIELGKTDSPVAKELKAEIEKSKDHLEKMLNSDIESAMMVVEKNIEREFQKPSTQKLLKDKHLGLFRKKLSTLNANQEEIKSILSNCVTSDAGENILHTTIVSEFVPESLENYNVPCLTTSNYNETLALCVSNSEELTVVDSTEENAKKGSELVASFFTKEIVTVEDNNGKVMTASNKNVAKMIVSEFNSSFITYYAGAENMEENLCNKMISECRGSLSNAVNNFNKRSNNSLLGKSALLTGLDLIDGDLDVADGIKKIGATVAATLGGAAPYVAIAAAAGAVTCGGVVAHNKSVKIGMATQDAAKRAVRNQMYGQRDLILEKYDEGAEKMLDQLNSVHNAKNNFDSAETRVRNANYTIQGIKSICQDVYDDYAKVIGG